MKQRPARTPGRPPGPAEMPASMRDLADSETIRLAGASTNATSSSRQLLYSE